MKNYIVGFGEILFDCLPEGRKLGGAPANFAYHAGQFGLNSIAISAIGADALGQEIETLLTKQHLAYHLPKTAQPTGTVQVTISGEGIPSYDICQGVAWDNIPWTDTMSSIAADTAAVCFGSLAQRSDESRQTIMRFLDAVPLTALKVFDINLRQHWFTKEIIEYSLQCAHILKINDEEIVQVKEMLSVAGDEPADICRALIKMYHLQMVILTCGAEGSYVFTLTDVSHMKTPKVKVADTVGAGDSFTGAFIAMLLKGKSIKEAHEKAVAVSAYVCTQAGPMPQLPDDLIK